MKKLLLAIITLIVFRFNAYSTQNITIKLMGHYNGKDASGRPLCLQHPTHICIFTTFIIEDGAVFPQGIQSATYLDPDTGNNVAVSNVSQIFFAGGYKLDFTLGATWVGPFSVNSSDWSF